MELQVKVCGWENKRLEDHHRQKWAYISEQEMQKHYPNGGYRVLADFKKKSSEDSIGYLCDKDQRIALFPYRAKLSGNTQVLGYICVEDENGEAYVRIVQSAGKWIWALICTVLIAIAVAVGVWFALSNQSKIPELDNAAIAYYYEGLENTDPSKISVPSFSVFPLVPGQTHINKVLANPKGNPCYFKYRLVLADSEEELYQSGLIAPGTAIPGFDINRSFTEGTYDIKLYVETRQLNDPEAQMNNAVLELKLDVKEETAE